MSVSRATTQWPNHLNTTAPYTHIQQFTQPPCGLHQVSQVPSLPITMLNEHILIYNNIHVINKIKISYTERFKTIVVATAILNEDKTKQFKHPEDKPVTQM